jgi:hypothetical protein
MGRAMCTTCLLLIIVSFASVGDTNGASIEATDATCSAADGKCHISTAATKNATAKEISLQEELELLVSLAGSHARACADPNRLTVCMFDVFRSGEEEGCSPCEAQEKEGFKRHKD